MPQTPMPPPRDGDPDGQPTAVYAHAGAAEASAAPPPPDDDPED